MTHYQGKNIVIIGLGITGLSCVNYFLAQNVIPKVIDTRHHLTGIEQLDSRIAYHVGSFHIDWILAADLIVVSPGIALSTPELILAKEHGIEIIGDIELFCREINSLDHKKVIAVTGSNGKTTVVSLIGEMLVAAGLKVGVGGNIGPPALSLLNNDCDFYVIELSSFQLETTYSLKAEAAVILNISEDHMDRYPEGMAQYAQAKLRIYDGAKNVIINIDDNATVPAIRSNEVNYIEFGRKRGNYHLDETAEHLMVNDEPVLMTKQLSLTGVHNWLNALVSLAVADILRLKRENSLLAIKAFTGLSHRFEAIFNHNDVIWINDSKATNVGSTQAALQSVECQGTLHLLLGGDGKSADFSPLIPYLFQREKMKIYCFGRDKLRLAKLRPEITIEVDEMADAVALIAKHIKPKDVVLLSPACASLDQFRNYEERGNLFARLAREFG